MHHHCRFAIIVVVTLAHDAHAQPAPSTDPAPPAAPAAPAPDAAGAASEPSFEPEPITAGKPSVPAAEPGSRDGMTLDQLVITSSNRIDLNFFGDVSLVQLRDQNAAIAIGPLGFQVTAHLAEGLVGRTEFVMSYQNGDTILDVERAYLEYRTDHWMFAAGRTHSELGYWNNAFHHGRWLQLTINRPHVLRFEDEGGVLQVHSVGISASYAPSRGDRGVELAVGVGNGHGRTIERIQTEGDVNLAKSALLRIGVAGVGHPGLRFGVNLGVDTIAPEPAEVRPLLPDRQILEIVTGVYVALRGEQLTLFSETYNIMHRGGGTTWQFTDGFLLVGYRFGRLIPFAMAEARHGDGLADPYYSPDPAIGSESVPPGNFVEAIAGLRYELSAWSALKLELAGSRVELAPSTSRSDYRAELNWSFGR